MQLGGEPGRCMVIIEIADCHILVREEEFYLYTLHDPTVSSKGIASSTIPFATLCPIVDRHTRFFNCCFSLFSSTLRARFKIFLSTLFYIGHGCGLRNIAHLTDPYKGGKVGGNPRKQDRIEAVQRRGGAVEVHKFAMGISKDQARYLEALALRATRLGGNVTNLKEEKVRGDQEWIIAIQSR